MKSLFNKETLQEIITRLNNLTPQTKPEWGKMNSAQMLAHVGQGYKTSTGELKLKRTFIGVLFGGMAKKSAIGSEKPFSKGLPTDKSFIISDPVEFEDEKKKLIERIEKFSTGGANGITKDTHPFFGELTPEEWDILMYKHTDHHLRQFGV